MYALVYGKMIVKNIMFSLFTDGNIPGLGPCLYGGGCDGPRPHPGVCVCMCVFACLLQGAGLVRIGGSWPLSPAL